VPELAPHAADGQDAHAATVAILLPAHDCRAGDRNGGVLALVATGSVPAHLGHAPNSAALVRAVGGDAAMAITYGIGLLVGTQV
jgi:hypothetical protein